CVLCGKREHEVILQATYPDRLTGRELSEIFRSSSDHKLMDQLVRCSECGLVFLNPRLRQGVVIDAYRAAVDPVFFQQNPMRIRTFRRSFLKLARRYGVRLERSTKVLDVGCAGGAFVKAAHDLGCSAVGIEPSQWLCEEGRRLYGLDIRSGV